MCERILLCVLGLTLMLTSSVLAAKRGLPEQVIPECFGVNIHFTGDNDKEVKMISEAGFKFVRMDFSWVHIEKEKGKYDFAAYDGLMSALDRHGIRPLFILDYGNPLYDNDMAPYTDEGRKAFAAFARAGASHFKDRGILWEIWNEPNGSGFWRPKPDPENYALLAAVTAKAIKEADPHATILGPALAGMELSYLERIFKGGVLENIDVLSVHPYRGGYPETVEGDYKAVRDLLDRYAPKGKNIPIVSGEWGFTAAQMSVEQQANFLVRQFLTNMMCGAKLSIWYDWHNDGQDPKEGEHNFGTLYWDFSPKPAYKAVQTLSKELQGCAFIRRLYAKDQNDYILLFKNERGYKLAAWTVGEAHEVSIPLDTQTVTLVGMTGERSREQVKSENIKLKLDQSVTYVVPSGESKRLSLEEAWEVSVEAPKNPNTSSYTVISRIKNTLGSEITVKGFGFADPSGELTSDDAGSRQVKLLPGKTDMRKLSYSTVWNGSSKLGVMALLFISDMDEPLCKFVEFDTSRRFTITAAPPADGSVILTFANPAGEKFDGSVMLSSGPGMTVNEITVPVKLEKGQTIAQIRYPVTLADRKQYTFRFMIIDGTNESVYAVADQTYRIAETFETPDKVDVIMDGNSQVSGSIDLSSSVPPKKMTGISSCTQIDYKFGSGWKFGRLVPKTALEIQGKLAKLGVWIYGDNSGNFIRARLTDSTGQSFQPHLATLDFEGWRFVTCDITPAKMGWWGGANDGVIHWPVKWDTLLVVDSNGGKEQSGTVYAGPLWTIY